MKNLPLSKTELSVFSVIGAVLLLYDVTSGILFGRVWLSAEALKIIGVSLLEIIALFVVIGYCAALVKWIAGRRNIDTTSRLYRIVRFGILLSAMFLALTGIQIIASLARGVLYIQWIPLFFLLGSGLALLTVMWAVPDKTRFLGVSAGLMLLIALLLLLRPASVENWWMDLLQATRPEKTLTETPVRLITMDEWPGSSTFGELLKVVNRSEPAVVGVLFAISQEEWKDPDTSLYSIIPPEKITYGVPLGWYGWDVLHGTVTSNTVASGLILPREIVRRIPRGVISGVAPGPPFSQVSNWGYEYVPVIGQQASLPFDQEELDASIVILAQYLGVKPPIEAEWNSALWSDRTVRVLGREIPTTSRGIALINHPTHYIVRQNTRFGVNSGIHATRFFVSPRIDSVGQVAERYTLLGSSELRNGRLHSGAWNSDGQFKHTDVAGTDRIEDFKGKIVLITRRQEHMGQLSQEVVGYSYAAILQSLLDSDFVIPLGRPWYVVLTILTAGWILFAFSRWRPARAVVLVLLGTAGLTFGLIALFAAFQAAISPYCVFVPALLGLILVFPVEIGRERRRMLEERTMLAAELRAAHDMQMGLMPKEDPVLAGYEIASACIPANEVGGDFYDYVWLDKKHSKLGIAVVDVSGKAMKAAMTAVLTSGMLYSETRKSSSPREVLRRINHPLYLRSDRRVFTALSFGVFDLKTRSLTYSCAGQIPPVLIRKGKNKDLRIQGVRLPLGLKEDLVYKELRLKLQKGDVVVFSTDGIVEAMNAKQEMYGFERVQKSLEEWHDLPATMIRDRLISDVKEHIGTASQHDDMTVVVVRVI